MLEVRVDGHDLRILRGAQGAWQAGCAVETTSGHQQAGTRPDGWLWVPRNPIIPEV
jgi:hypothetical protein